MTKVIYWPKRNRKALFFKLNSIGVLIFTKGDERLKPKMDILSSREEKEILEGIRSR